MNTLDRRRSPDILLALSDPAAYPHPAGPIVVVQTHISIVFLAGPHAYKVKKAVDMGFLDYTSLASRRFYSHEEVRLNRRLAPDVYLGVVPIVEQRGRLRIGGAGRVRDYAVQMRRLPADRMMDRMLAAGLVEAHHLGALAELIARFHAAVEPAVPAEGAPAMVARVARQNLAEVEQFVGRTISAARYRAVASATQEFLEAASDRLAARAATGRVREGHGDLRPENVCLEAQPIVFDGVEFSRRLRVADVAAEVAFMAMELEAAGRPDLARCFVDAYVAASGDAEIPELLDFYRCQRAVVRGKVISLRLAQVGAAPELLHRAGAYFELAERYAAVMRRSLAALAGGPPAGAGCRGVGSGRSAGG
ncbi:MAG: phosphotransferase [Chloroflexi bacterium]|nr:phosphotransferase [Chloroflexota bacterium]